MSQRPQSSVPPPAPRRPAIADDRPAGSEQPLTAILHRRTQRLHVEAERSGIVREILHRRASRFGYALYLRNLLPAYEALENGLERNRRAACPNELALPELYRREALSADLVGLYGPDWKRYLPLLPAGKAYARGVTEAACTDNARLLAHAYVRYLGDLNGGRILRRLLAASLGLGPSTLAFYSFPNIVDLETFKVSYRQVLNDAVDGANEIEAAGQEAERAFRFNIAVSEAVLAAAGNPPNAVFASPPAAP